MSATLKRVYREVLPDTDPETSYLTQDEFLERFAAYERGEFSFVGIRAAATVAIKTGTMTYESTVRTPGCWGIEDDSGEAYFEQVYVEELETLAGLLDELGVRLVPITKKALLAFEPEPDASDDWYCNDCGELIDSARRGCVNPHCGETPHEKQLREAQEAVA